MPGPKPLLQNLVLLLNQPRFPLICALVSENDLKKYVENGGGEMRSASLEEL